MREWRAGGEGESSASLPSSSSSEEASRQEHTNTTHTTPSIPHQQPRSRVSTSSTLLICVLLALIAGTTQAATQKPAAVTLPCGWPPVGADAADAARRRPPDKQCLIWSRSVAEEACWREGGEARQSALAGIYIQAGAQPLTALQLFQAAPLQAGERGRDCVRGSRQHCRACMRRLDERISQLQSAFAEFDKTLYRFDCMLARDTASATRPFSPNGTCHTCRTWYARWLLVQVVDVWRTPPCINWCYYAQLACPHLATSKVVDYAGHPSFQCRDLHISSASGIPSSASHDRLACSCLHPCDVRGVVLEGEGERKEAGGGGGGGEERGKRGTHMQHGVDFFAAAAHCSVRAAKCAAAAAASPTSSSAAGIARANSGPGRPVSAMLVSLACSLLLLLLLTAPL